MSSNLELLKRSVCNWIDNSYEKFTQLAHKMYNEPELGFEEEKAAKWLSETLENYGYAIKRNLAGQKTAFRATLTGTSEKPKVALFCEYDALPDIGHGCGHNLIGTASAWAGAALRELDAELPGTIVIFGTPGEETGGGKVYLANENEFDDIDTAMMFHPSTENQILSSTLALDALEVTFYGKTAHAAGSPHLGINALDAVILTFNGINALRQHLTDDVRIHGIISEGGKAPNIVPERAQARFYIRAKERRYLNEVVEKFKNICEGASLMTGTTFKIRKFENSNDNLISNKIVGKLFEKNLNSLGITEIRPYHEDSGSTDMGNVSQIVPAIHPYLTICGQEIICHSREFAQATITTNGLNTLKNAAKALAMTTLDLLYNPDHIHQAKLELIESKNGVNKPD
ncbi:MAG: M20 family metallopeptidase [Halanaerobiales bacterium]|nr:M20 family metallopeptidase [Halanaerobiales bacterium]